MAVSGLEALLAPGKFKGKDKDNEQLLVDFDLYVKTVNNFFITVGKDDASDKVKVATLQALGGPEMVDLLELQGKVQLVAIQADAAQGVVAVAADSYEVAIKKIRDAIVASTNNAMARLKLFQQMPQQGKAFAIWGAEVIKQARRVDWTAYGDREAARDAILFQTSDAKLRKKILAENLDLERTVEWGKANESSGRKARQVEETTNTNSDKTKIRKLEEQLCRLQVKGAEEVKCNTCTRSHTQGKTCPGLSATCFSCGLQGHFKGAKVCKGTKSKGDKPKGDKKGQRVSKVEEESSTDTSEAEGLGRIVQVAATKGQLNTDTTDFRAQVSIRPRQGGSKAAVVWTVDSGVRKTLLAEADWARLKIKNPAWKLKKNHISFKPYGTQITLEVMGKAKVVLKNKAGLKRNAMVYVIQGAKESLLGRLDAEALGILQLSKSGKGPVGEEVKSLTGVKRSALAKETEFVSGAQTQPEIDKAMEQMLSKYPDLFKGIGCAKVSPIHIRLKEGAVPVTQKQRPVPVHFLEPMKELLDTFVKEGVVEGPLGASHATGWVHNVVMCGKKWDPKAVRLNLDTRTIKKHMVEAHYPIPTVEQVRHSLAGSDRFSSLDCNHAFYQFPIDKETQDIFKFTTPFGIYRFKRLVMGAPPASGECHSIMAEILRGLPGVIQIKDDIVVYGEGIQHDSRLEAVLVRIRQFGLTLRREKCKLGQQQILWFGHVFSKDGMSPDPEKVETIRQWPAPTSKAEIKSFLQTVQFVAPYMRVGPGDSYSDVTASLRRLTSIGTHFRWTQVEQGSFEKLKKLLVSDTVLMNYEKDRPTRLYVDHGPKGVAATVAQGYKVGGQTQLQWRSVYHNSRALTKAELNYQKIEGESLAVFSGIKSNQRYLLGTEFVVITDHEPLVPLYGNPYRPAPTRVDRHRFMHKML